jgi:hypothetical protein
MPSSAGSPSTARGSRRCARSFWATICSPVTPSARCSRTPGDDFIFTCKETSHKALYDFIDGAELSRREEKIRRRNAKETFRYRWIEAVPIRDGKDALLVNWIGFEIVDAKGKVKYSMAWVTSLPVSQDNVAEIVACGRSRWKIENESFNVLKNHGYFDKITFPSPGPKSPIVRFAATTRAFALDADRRC